MIRTIWVLVVGAVLTLYYSAAVLWAQRGRPAEASRACETKGRRWSRLVLRLAGARVHLDDNPDVDWDRPLVVVVNHQSWFDVFALAGFLPGRTRFVAKKELARIPVFGAAWQACGHISVDRGDRSRAISSLDAAGRRVRDESLVMILFPEGTRSVDGRLQPFKKGAFVLAIKTGVPVVPVAIHGSRDVMPKGSFRIRPGEIRIRVGDPIEVDELGHRERNRLLERSREAVAHLMNELGGDAGDPSLTHGANSSGGEEERE